MKALKRRYRLLRIKAFRLMKAGRVNAYMATLIEVNELRNRMSRPSAA